MKKLFSLLLTLLLLSACLVPAAGAVPPQDTPTEAPSEAAPAREDADFSFLLAVNGSDSIQVQPGDVITVVFTLSRSGADGDYDMYAMQNEIRYDSSFFRFVEGSAMLSDGISSTHIALRDSYREFYMNFVSLSGGERWEKSRVVGSFQLEVIAQSGVTHITNQDYLVSTADGRGTYSAVCQDVTVLLSSECTVTFQCGGGTSLDPVTAVYGEKLVKPADPLREGYRLAGWYTDLDLKDPWDFDTDTVRGNMTLFARWEKQDAQPLPEEEPQETDGGSGLWWLLIILALLLLGAAVAAALLLGKKTVRFETNCEEELDDQRVRKGGFAQRPQQPRRMGRTFAGWYSDEDCTQRWNFETDPVKENITLYAKWL